MRAAFVLGLVLIVFAGGRALAGAATEERVNLLALQEGTLPVVAPDSYSGWPVEALLDESPRTGWACATGHTKDNTFVFELQTPAAIERFEFDNAGVDEAGTAAKDVSVEISSISKDAGFTPMLRATLADRKDRQSFKATAAVAGRWVRLRVHANYGHESWTELLSFRGYGVKPPVPAPPAGISGTYETSYSAFHLRQQGTALVGCYEFNSGLFQGAIEGRVMKITWQEQGEDNRGPAVLVFSSDGRRFRGFWWRAGREAEEIGGSWEGEKTGNAVGSCPHWTGSLGGEMKKKLQSDGRVRVYGILFDINSASLRPESRPVLDEVVGVLQSEPAWKLAIEGHTDSTGSDSQNAALSGQRAEAVRTYLVKAGIAANRLQTQGFGESKPVADNGTELGRAQNRRVELVRK